MSFFKMKTRNVICQIELITIVVLGFTKIIRVITGSNLRIAPTVFSTVLTKINNYPVKRKLQRMDDEIVKKHKIGFDRQAKIN